MFVIGDIVKVVNDDKHPFETWEVYATRKMNSSTVVYVTNEHGNTARYVPEDLELLENKTERMRPITSRMFGTKDKFHHWMAVDRANALILAEYIVEYGMDGSLPNQGYFLPEGNKEKKDVLDIALIILGTKE